MLKKKSQTKMNSRPTPSNSDPSLTKQPYLGNKRECRRVTDSTSAVELENFDDDFIKQQRSILQNFGSGRPKLGPKDPSARTLAMINQLKEEDNKSLAYYDISANKQKRQSNKFSRNHDIIDQ